MAEAIDLKSIKCEFESHLPDQLLENIFKHVRVEGDCLLWTGAITKSTGYGKIKWKYKAYDVHRLIGIYLFIIPGEVCHVRECPHKHCIRPKHLYDGTRSTNMQDAVAKGTHNWQNKGFKSFGRRDGRKA